MNYSGCFFDVIKTQFNNAAHLLLIDSRSMYLDAKMALISKINWLFEGFL